MSDILLSITGICIIMTVQNMSVFIYIISRTFSFADHATRFHNVCMLRCTQTIYHTWFIYFKLVLLCLVWYSFSLHQMNFKDSLKLIGCMRRILYIYIIDYVSVFLYLHMLGVSPASITNRVTLITRFEVIFFVEIWLLIPVSSGHGSISSKLLKYLTPSISAPIIILINNSLHIGTVPRNMKIIPTHKAKEKLVGNQ